MAEITAALVKELREKTGAGMMDCKKALAATNGDLEPAVDWLRKQGLAAASKKAGRVAAEGLVGVQTSGNKGAMVEVNSETDFVARNEKFQDFVATVTKLALDKGADLEALRSLPYPGGKTVADKLTDLVATIGENMQLRRIAHLSVSQGIVASYVHAAAAPGPRQDRHSGGAGIGRRRRQAAGARAPDRHACGGGKSAIGVGRQS